METATSYIMIIDETTNLRQCYSVNLDSTMTCVMCEHDIPFGASSTSLKVLNEYVEPTIAQGISKIRPEDYLSDQERFLKEREKRNFRKSIRKL